ncbi:hypothetical protein ACOME3_008894 [Neoechinorhynchus agilis]
MNSLLISLLIGYFFHYGHQYDPSKDANAIAKMSNTVMTTVMMNKHEEKKRGTIFQYYRLQSRTRRAAIANPMNLWPGAIIPYEITYNYSGQFLQMIHFSMRMWMKSTCILFTEREMWHTSWLRIQPGACGCCSQVGRQVLGAQYLYLSEECDRPGIMAHEFGHAIGFWHEHTRPDRDDYIYVIDDNVNHDQRYNFVKKTDEDVDSLGESYDPHSIMHYAPNTFSKSDMQFTIILRRTGYQKQEDKGEYDYYLDAMGQLGQRIQPSKGDIVQTNKLYRCPPCGGNLILKNIKEPLIVEPLDDITQCQYCAWRMITSAGNRIVLEVEEIHLYRGQIGIIYDSYHRNLRILGYINGRQRNLRDLSTSSSHVSFIELWGSNVQEAMESMPKFRLIARVQCGGQMSSPYAFISNPAYPDPNDDSEACEWTINGPERSQINLIIGYVSINGGGVHDFTTGIVVYDGNCSCSELPLLKRLSGKDRCNHSIYLSTRSNSMKIRMISHNGGSVAFRAVYQTSQSRTFYIYLFLCFVLFKGKNSCSIRNGGCSQICNSVFGKIVCECDIGYKLLKDGRSCKTLSSIESVLKLAELQRNKENCKEHIRLGVRRPFSIIRSPRDDSTNRYPSNLSCSWLIEAPIRRKIIFKFEEFEIEGSPGICTYDRLQFTQLHPYTNRHLGTRVLCGNRKPRPFTSRSNLVNVTFVTDISNNARGFVLKFKI